MLQNLVTTSKKQLPQSHNHSLQSDPSSLSLSHSLTIYSRNKSPPKLFMPKFASISMGHSEQITIKVPRPHVSVTRPVSPMLREQTQLMEFEPLDLEPASPTLSLLPPVPTPLINRRNRLFPKE